VVPRAPWEWRDGVRQHCQPASAAPLGSVGGAAVLRHQDRTHLPSPVPASRSWLVARVPGRERKESLVFSGLNAPGLFCRLECNLSCLLWQTRVGRRGARLFAVAEGLPASVILTRMVLSSWSGMHDIASPTQAPLIFHLCESQHNSCCCGCEFSLDGSANGEANHRILSSFFLSAESFSCHKLHPHCDEVLFNLDF